MPLLAVFCNCTFLRCNHCLSAIGSAGQRQYVAEITNIDNGSLHLIYADRRFCKEWLQVLATASARLLRYNLNVE